MSPIFFPFTYVTAPVAEMLAACFRPVVVYQPSEKNIPEAMRLMDAQGLLSIQTPVWGDEEAFEKICKNYVEWLNVHSGSELDYLKIHKDRIPFFDENSSLKFRAEITQNLRRPEVEETPSPLFSARLFLHVAQDYDIKAWDIRHGLASVGRMEQELLDRLKGEDARPGTHSDAFDQTIPAIDKTSERIRAWAYLFLSDEAQCDERASGVFLTTSRTVIQQLQEDTAEFHEIFKVVLNTAPVDQQERTTGWNDALVAKITHLAATDWSVLQQEPETFLDGGDGSGNASLSVFLVPDVSPRVFFSRLINPDADALQGVEGAFKNTVIGLIEA